MKAKTVLIWVIVLAVGSLVLGLALEPRFGDQIAIHWDEQGVADGYGSRFMGLFFMPIIIVGLSLLLLGIPQIDPLKKNIDKFQNEYYVFILIFAAYFAFLHVLTLLYNVGLKFNMLAMMIPAMAGLYYYLGVMLGKAKQNYFIGIRTHGHCRTRMSGMKHMLLGRRDLNWRPLWHYLAWFFLRWQSGS